MEVAIGNNHAYNDDWEYDEEPHDDYFDNNSGEGEEKQQNQLPRVTNISLLPIF